MSQFRIALPSTDLKVCPIALGTGSYGSKDRISEEEAFVLLDQYFDLGGNVLDTANVYGRWDSPGLPLSEPIVGRWLATRHHRDDIVLSTKGACPNLRTMSVSRMSPEEVRSDLEDSLRNLGTDYIDIYWLHHDDPTRSVVEILETLSDFVDKGLVRYFGCSNWRPERILEALRAAAARELRGFIASQVMFNLALPNPSALEPERMVALSADAHQLHLSEGFPLFAYSSQASGFFSLVGREDFFTEPCYERVRNFFLNDVSIARASEATALAVNSGVDPTQVALAYVLRQPFPTVAIIGPENRDELKLSLATLTVDLKSVPDTTFRTHPEKGAGS